MGSGSIQIIPVYTACDSNCNVCNLNGNAKCDPNPCQDGSFYNSVTSNCQSKDYYCNNTALLNCKFKNYHFYIVVSM